MNSDGKFNPDHDWSVTDEEASTSEAAAIWAGDRVIAFAVYSSKGFYRDSHPSIDANARLIAAAPDLLESAKLLIDSYDICRKDRTPDVIFERLRAAIAKATGETV
jgi:hypothetical protein